LSGQHSSAAVTASGAVTPRSLQQLVAWLSAATSDAGASAWAPQQHHQLPGDQVTRSATISNRRKRLSFKVAIPQSREFTAILPP
jgi:hypothetical protein